VALLKCDLENPPKIDQKIEKILHQKEQMPWSAFSQVRFVKEIEKSSNDMKRFETIMMFFILHHFASPQNKKL
jgi:hypothetical protein